MSHSLKPVSLVEIARRARTSPSTVSRVLNDVPGNLVSRTKRQQIKALAMKLGYRRNRGARAFSTGRTECVGLAIGSGLFNRWGQRATAALLLETVQGVTERLAELNHTVMFAVVPTTDPDGYLRQQFLSEQRVDGVIMLIAPSKSLGDDLRRHGIPSVAVTHYRPHGTAPMVGVDSYPGVSAAVERIRALGHRRAGYIGFQPSPSPFTSGERQLQFCETAKEHGVVLDPEFSIPAADETQAYLLVREMAGRRDLPSVLFCSCDHYAVMAIRALTDAGKRVPAEVSVVGYDDAPYASTSPVELSTVRIPRKEVGRVAAQLVVNMRHEPDAPRSSIIVPAEWVERASLGRAPG